MASSGISDTSFASKRSWPTMEKLPGGWRIHHCPRRQDQGRCRVTTLRQNRFLVLLSLRNHPSTAKALEINFRRAAEVHLPDQTLRNRLNDDRRISRRPARGPVLTAQHYAVRINFAREHQNRQLRHWMPILHAD